MAIYIEIYDSYLLYYFSCIRSVTTIETELSEPVDPKSRMSTNGEIFSMLS